MREDRTPRRATSSAGQVRVELDFSGEAATTALAQVRSALDALTAPLDRVSNQTRLLAREQKEAHQQALEFARTLGRTLPAEVDELERSFRRAFQSESGLKGMLRSFVSEARRLLQGLLEDWTGGHGGPAFAGSAYGGGAFASLLGLAAATPPLVSSAFPLGRRTAGLPGVSLAQILTRLGINLRGIGGASGSMVLGGGLTLALAGYQMGGVGGSILGAGGGALAGFAVAGPIGAIVGGIAGLLGGIFGGGRGEKKRQATEIANRGFEQIRDLFFRYQQFRLDYGEALARMQQIWSEMEARWREIGGSVGRQSISSQRPYFDQILRAMEEIQRERQRRAGVLAGFPLPEFQGGGVVSQGGGSTRAGVLAVLHPGEFVMRREAVELLGRPRLEEMNRGSPPAAAGDSFQVTIIAADAHGFEEMLRRNEDGLVRVLRRAARDRGRSAPL